MRDEEVRLKGYGNWTWLGSRLLTDGAGEGTHA